MQRIFICDGEGFMGEGIEPPQGHICKRVYTPIPLFTIGVDCEIQSGGREERA